MYGTVARLKVEVAKEQELREHIQDFGRPDVNGFVASVIYKADAGGQEYWLAVVFDSQESYRANAESPEQDARYRKMREYLAADPEWHDGEVIGRFVAGS